MKRKMLNIEISEELLNEIILTAYGDAPFTVRRKIKSLAKQNEKVAELLEQYRDTANTVHSLEEVKCPQSIIEKVENFTKTKTNNRSFFTDWISIWYSRPLISAATGAAVIVVIFLSILIQRPEEQIQVPSEEVRIAELQTQKALEIVGKIFAKTRATFKNEIMTEHISKPINKGINKVNDLFKTGGNNENTIN